MLCCLFKCCCLLLHKDGTAETCLYLIISFHLLFIVRLILFSFFIVLFHRLKPSWSTSLGALLIVPSLPMASPKLAESWSSKCHWWSGWKVKQHFTLTHSGTHAQKFLFCLSDTVSEPSAVGTPS